jgi:hypothetical protein
MKLGHGGLFRSEHWRRLVVSYVVIQVVVFLLDDNSEVVLEAYSVPFDEPFGANCVCVYKVFLLKT